MFQTIVSQLNWLHVLVATIAYFALGAVWYGPLFSKAWIKGHNIDVNHPDGKKGMGKLMGLSFIAFFVITLTVAIILQVVQAFAFIHAIKWGAFLGLGMATPVIVINHLYLKRPVTVHLIDALYHVVGLTIASLVLVLWR